MKKRKKLRLKSWAIWLLLAIFLTLLIALFDNLHLIDARGNNIYLSSQLISYITFTSLILGIIKILKTMKI